jgi:Single-strand binding protein family.
MVLQMKTEIDRNQITLSGSVSSLPSWRKDGTSATFEVDSYYELKGEGRTLSVSVVAYGRTAEAVMKKLKCGNRVFIAGMLRRDKEGKLIIAALEVLLNEEKENKE